MRRLGAVLMLLLTSGCATITTGITQSILVDTDPTGAICKFRRQGADIGVVNPTPGMLLITKSVDQLEADCHKDGYLPTQKAHVATLEPMYVGNFLLGGVIGMAVDMASGAAAKYDGVIKIFLTPVAKIDVKAIAP